MFRDSFPFRIFFALNVEAGTVSRFTQVPKQILALEFFGNWRFAVWETVIPKMPQGIYRVISLEILLLKSRSHATALPCMDKNFSHQNFSARAKFSRHGTRADRHVRTLLKTLTNASRS